MNGGCYNMLRLEDIFTEEFKQYNCETKTEILRKTFMKNHTQILQKNGMEFCYIYGFFHNLEELIAKNKQSPHQDNWKWARIYEILLDIQTGKQEFCSWLEALKQMNNRAPETQEMECLIQLTKVNIATQTNNTDEIKSSFHTFYQNYQRMEDRMLAYYFNLRFSTYKMRYFFENHELIALKMTAYDILKETDVPTITTIAHIFLGASYIVHSYDQVISHFRTALQIAEANGLKYLIRAIEDSCLPFVYAHKDELTYTRSKDSYLFELIEAGGSSRTKLFAILDRFPIDCIFKLMTEK